MNVYFKFFIVVFYPKPIRTMLDKVKTATAELKTFTVSARLINVPVYSCPPTVYLHPGQDEQSQVGSLLKLSFTLI